MKSTIMIGIGNGLELFAFTDESTTHERLGIRPINGSRFNITDLGPFTDKTIAGLMDGLERLKIHASPRLG